jgi:hypothetical protein
MISWTGGGELTWLFQFPEFGTLVQEICTALNVTATINTTLPATSSTPSTSAPIATFTGAAPYAGVGTGIFAVLGSVVIAWALYRSIVKSISYSEE